MGNFLIKNSDNNHFWSANPNNNDETYPIAITPSNQNDLFSTTSVKNKAIM